MANDDPKALERALSAIVKDMIANGPKEVGVAASKLEIPVPRSDTAAVAIVKGGGPSVLEWITTVKKQLAPHADKVPVPVIQGIAKVFPPAGAAVPILKYIQTTPPAKGSASAAAVVPAPSQIFIIPINAAAEAPAPEPVNPQVKALQRTAVRLAQFCRTHPALALLVAYGLYRARNVPGNTKDFEVFLFEVLEKLDDEDPFADEGESHADNPTEVGTSEYIHIRIQQRNGRKTLTTLQGLPTQYDAKKLLKAFKKEFACNGTLVEDEKMGKVIQLQGDQRAKISNFLVENGLEKSTIKVHGF
ncbi:hypothetical protein EST38_g4855 [Candolleomyces aberdarensis]|uniref:SUI1 domain-containing protein n=1 Tax=Candolleomyces aberdarensis TaxID=2316362 RepID=A0A4Q2DQ79_9AGAR|nr:hypothetical protein EST38_g4855 [Candolleomyces aberdarensis]